MFLAMNYHGFIKLEMKSQIEDFKNRNTIVIEDITHSILSAELKENDEYINPKLNATKLKAEYMETGNQKLKPMFLERFTKLDNLLSNEYKEFKIDDISLSILNSIDITKIKNVEQMRIIFIII